MLEPDYVREVLVALTKGPGEHAALTRTLLHSA